MIHTKTIKREIERKLEVYSVDELIFECKKVLQDLRQFETENKFQIAYYSKMWELLSEY